MNVLHVKYSLNILLSELETLSRSVELLQEQLQCDNTQMFEINLVLEELCANIITHGSRGGASLVEVELVKEWEELVVTISDDGPPFDPTIAPKVDIHQPLEGRCQGGLGIHLVEHYTDSFKYRREDGKNIVTFTKNI